MGNHKRDSNIPHEIWIVERYSLHGAISRSTHLAAPIKVVGPCTRSGQLGFIAPISTESAFSGNIPVAIDNKEISLLSECRMPFYNKISTEPTLFGAMAISDAFSPGRIRTPVILGVATECVWVVGVGIPIVH